MADGGWMMMAVGGSHTTTFNSSSVLVGVICFFLVCVGPIYR